MKDKLVNIENSQKKELELLKEKYLEVTMPKEQFDKLKLAIEKGKEENRKEHQRIVWNRFARSVAAVLLVFVILPNTSADAAYAMGQIPVLGNLVKLVTWRDYEYEDERHHADVSVAKLEVAKLEEAAENPDNIGRKAAIEEETQGQASRTMDDSGREEKNVRNHPESTTEEEQMVQNHPESTTEEEQNVRNHLEKTTEEINAEIEEITNNLIEEFETHMQEEMGYQDLIVKSEILTTTQDYFTLKLLCYQGAGSGYEWNYYYTIDLGSGDRLQLKDLFIEGADYMTPISENIKKQMQEQMAADENVYYWLEDEIEEWNFKSITEDTLFYLNEDGKLIISFNEGDVAPMYMGVVEFEIEEEVIEEIKK